MTRRALFGLAAAAIAGRGAAPAKTATAVRILERVVPLPQLYFLETNPGGSKIFRDLYLSHADATIHAQVSTRVCGGHWAEAKPGALFDEARVIL